IHTHNLHSFPTRRSSDLETGVHSKNITQAENKIKELTSLLSNEPELAQSLRTYLISLFSSYDALTLYTDAGILPGHGFFSEANRSEEHTSELQSRRDLVC